MDWIQCLLEVDIHKRHSCEDSLNHVWLKGKENELINYIVDKDVLLGLKQAKKLHKLHFEMNELFTEFLEDSQIKNIRETFQAIDIDDSGTIELNELRSAYS